jgi:hypothetical protein
MRKWRLACSVDLQMAGRIAHTSCFNLTDQSPYLAEVGSIQSVDSLIPALRPSCGLTEPNDIPRSGCPFCCKGAEPSHWTKSMTVSGETLSRQTVYA